MIHLPRVRSSLAEFTQEDHMKTIYRTNDSLMADAVEALLNDNNIPFIKKEHGLGAYGHMLFGRAEKGNFEIQVSDEDAEKAEEIIGVLV